MKTKEDSGIVKVLGYLIIFILVLFIILPPVFRFLFSEEEIKNSNNSAPIINKLVCTKNENFTEYTLTTKVDNEYENGELKYSAFIYTVNIIDPDYGDVIVPEEYDYLKLIENVDFFESNNVYTLTMDYRKFNYNNIEQLQIYQKTYSDQKNYFNDNGFNCN